MRRCFAGATMGAVFVACSSFNGASPPNDAGADASAVEDVEDAGPSGRFAVSWMHAYGTPGDDVFEGLAIGPGTAYVSWTLGIATVLEDGGAPVMGPALFAVSTTDGERKAYFNLPGLRAGAVAATSSSIFFGVDIPDDDGNVQLSLLKPDILGYLGNGNDRLVLGGPGRQSVVAAVVDPTTNVRVLVSVRGETTLIGKNYTSTPAAASIAVLRWGSDLPRLAFTEDTADQFGTSIGIDVSGVTITGGWTKLDEDDALLHKYEPGDKASTPFQFGGANAQHVSSVSEDKSGTLVAGTFKGTLKLGTLTLQADNDVHAFAARLDDKLVPQWASDIGVVATDWVGIVSDPVSSQVHVAGTFAKPLTLGGDALSSASGATDMFVAHLDGTTGKVVSGERFGGDGNEVASVLATDGAGSLFLGGTFDKELTAGRTTVRPVGGRDIALLRLVLK